MDFYGYGSSGYKDFNFLPNEQATKKTIEFTVTEGSAYDALDGMGFLINSSITGTTYGASGNQVINGYLLFFQYTGSGVGASIKLFKLEDVNTYYLHHNSSGKLFDSANIDGVSLVSTASTSYGSNQFRKIKIEVMPDYLEVWYDGSSSNNSTKVLDESHLVKWPSGLTKYPLVASYDTINNVEIYRGGYGPLISYRSHNCGQLTHFTLSNLSMEAEYVRSLTEVIREANWSSDKASFLVNLNEDSIEDFSNVYTTGEIINRLADEL